jgi:biotin carboxyl carrier protein
MAPSRWRVSPSRDTEQPGDPAFTIELDGVGVENPAAGTDAVARATGHDSERTAAGDEAETMAPGDEAEQDDTAAPPRVIVAEVIGSAGTGALQIEVVAAGWRFGFEVEDARRAEIRERATRQRAEIAHGATTDVRAIIPGRVVSVAVAGGDEIEAGQPLLVVEAMKMQNEVRSPRAGRVQRVAVAPGTTIELGDLLLTIDDLPIPPDSTASPGSR